MVTVEFQQDDVLMVTFSEQVSAEDVDRAWAALGEPDFTVEHDVIVHTSGASIGFSAVDIPPIIRRRDRLPADAQGITCFVTDLHLAAAVVRLIEGLVLRNARWHVVPDISSARALIEQRRRSYEQRRRS